MTSRIISHGVLGLVFFLMLLDQAKAAEIKIVGSKISIASSPLREDEPTSTFNSKNMEFFVVWDQTVNQAGDTYIMGRFITLNGVKRPSRRYSFGRTEIARSPVLSYGSIPGTYVLLWTLFSPPDMNTEAGLYTRIISQTGQVIKKSFLGSYTTGESQIAYHSATNTYVTLSLPSYLWLSSTGAILKEIPAKDLSPVFLAADRASGKTYFIGRETGARNRFLFQTLLPDGQLALSTPFISLNPRFHLLSATYNPQLQEILIILSDWSLQDTSKQNIHSLRLSTSGTIKSPPRKMVSNASRNDYVACIRSRQHYLIAYEKNDQIYLRKIGNLGGPLGPEVKATSGDPQRAFYVSLTSPSPGGRLLLSWRSSDSSFRNTDIWAQVIEDK